MRRFGVRLKPVGLSWEKRLSFVWGAFNFAPLFKRLFWWSPEMYFMLSVMPLLVLLSPKFQQARALAVSLAVPLLILILPLDRFVAYIPLLFLLFFVPAQSIERISSAIYELRFIFYFSILYGLYQKINGYLDFEMAWIASGLGAVGEAGYFVTDDIRPFSFYAGVPEFGFFSGLIAYVAWKCRSYMLFLAGIGGVLLAGSRGVLVSVLIASLAIFLIERAPRQRRLLVVVGVVLAFFAYLYLVFVIPSGGLSMADGESRMMVAGTFNARVIMLDDFVSKLNIENVWFGVHLDEQVFDNFYLTILNDFGLVGLFVFVLLMLFAVRSNFSAFSCVATLSYCFYADAILSVHLFFGALVMILSRETGRSAVETVR